MAICGAKKRNGEACQKPPIKGKTKCRLHGGLSKPKPAPKNNKFASKHNIYSQFMTEDEIEFSQQSELHSVDSELKLCKVQLTRALKAKQAQDDAIKDQDKVAIDSMTLGDANPQDQSGGDRIVYKRKDYDALNVASAVKQSNPRHFGGIFAERITAHKTLLNMHYWQGFSFLIGGGLWDRTSTNYNRI